VDQLRALPATRPVLVGFSKSGLGAWNLARELGDALAATVIFDAPMARLQTPPWDAARFYPDDAAWQRDLPALHVPQMTGRFAPGPLIMVTGCKFHDEMVQVSRRMAQAKIDHCLLPQPQREHHWQSGWLQDALAGLAAMGVLAASADPA
jgi:pimeloyl-ACP methyl ester carboxylesterase